MGLPRIGKTRLEAFSDGVLAIILTIMVIEIKAPHSPDVEAFIELMPKFMSYLMSFLIVGIYWNNHHHMLHMCAFITGRILWANLHLLFWLSLIPFSTAWMGENHFAQIPIFIYGCNLLLCSIGYYLLQLSIIQSQGSFSKLQEALGGDWKGKISPIIYILGIVVSFWEPLASFALYGMVSLLWLLPDRRIERVYHLRPDA